MTQTQRAASRTSHRKHSYRRGMQFACPHCDADLVVRSSERVSATYRRALLECTNEDCGWRGTLDASIVDTRTPSECPREAVQLPLSPRAARTLTRAMEAHTADSQRAHASD